MDNIPILPRVDDLDQVFQYMRQSESTNRSKPRKKSPKRANYDGMSFNDAFASARKAGKSSFNWHGKQYTTELAPTRFEVPLPTISPEPMDRVYNEADTSPRPWNPTTAMASYQADAGLRRAAMAPVQRVPLTGVNVPQYGLGGWLLPL